MFSIFSVSPSSLAKQIIAGDDMGIIIGFSSRRSSNDPMILSGGIEACSAIAAPPGKRWSARCVLAFSLAVSGLLWTGILWACVYYL
jgi:hypothetical protein